MSPPALAALLLLLLAPATSGGTKGPEALHRWLQDPEARRGFLQLWRGGRSPLAAAFDAYSAHDASSPAMDEQCALDVAKLLDSRALWALRMLDASVKTPVGLLAQAWTHLGNWDECVGVRGVVSDYLNRTFHGQMCMVRFQAEKPQAGPLERMQLSLGMCVPSSCSAQDVEMLMEALEPYLNIVEGVKLEPSVSDADCTTLDAPYLDSADVIAVMVLSVLAALVVLSTAYDVTTPAAHKRALPAAFSLVANGRKLLALPRPDADHSLACLHGLRFLSCCWVILMHRYQTSSAAPSVNPRFAVKLYEDFWHLYFSHGSLAVDTFLVIAGLLLAYLFFKQDATKQRLNIPLHYLHRYIRVTPALAMVILVTSTLLYRTGWGPLWSTSVGGMRDVCREYWWKSLLYVSNYVEPLQQCVSQSWYLNVDMQLHWLSPLFLLPIVWMPSAGLTWVFLLCLTGVVCNFLLLQLQDLHATPSAAVQDPAFLMKNMKNFYYPTHTRFVPYLVGLLCGYFIAFRQRWGQLKPLSIPRAAVTWLLVAVLLLGNFLAYYMLLTEPGPPKVVVSVYSSVERPAWGVGVALLVYLCAMGNGGPVNAFLSWWGFHILGRLSYSAYLVHFALMKTSAGALKTQLFLGDAELMTQYCGDLVAALVFAAALFMVCEAPFAVLEKELLGHKRGTVATAAPSEPSAVVTTQPETVVAPDTNEGPASDSMGTLSDSMEPAVDSPPHILDTATDAQEKLREIV